MGWTLQRSRRARGWYFQIVHGVGPKRVALTLGYLSDDEEARARSRLGSLEGPEHLLDPGPAPEGGEPPPPPSKAAMTWAARYRLLDDSVEIAESVFEAWAREARRETTRKIAEGDYSRLTLREFRDEMWLPLRKQEAAASTIRSERPYWKAILDALGNVRLKDLSTVRWTAFLASQTTWSGRSQSLAQNAYRQALKYAAEIGAIEDVHPFRKRVAEEQPVTDVSRCVGLPRRCSSAGLGEAAPWQRRSEVCQ